MHPACTSKPNGMHIDIVPSVCNPICMTITAAAFYTPVPLLLALSIAEWPMHCSPAHICTSRHTPIHSRHAVKLCWLTVRNGTRSRYGMLTVVTCHQQYHGLLRDFCAGNGAWCALRGGQDTAICRAIAIMVHACYALPA